MSLQTETARDILLDAFDDMVVHIDGESLETSDALTGIKAINRIMATLDANGVSLGFTKLDNISDPITIPEAAMDSLVSLLALRLWPKYRTVPATPEIVVAASNALRQMYLLGVTIAPTEYPSTLPTGSGNTGNQEDDIFYPDLEATILGEFNGSISLEDSTE